jgi:hypothetical protein
MDIPEGMTKTSTTITQRDDCSIELPLLFNERIHEDAVFKSINPKALNTI